VNKNKFGEIVFDDVDLCNLLFQKGELPDVTFISDSVSIDNSIVDTKIKIQPPTDNALSVNEFDSLNQQCWYMPDDYKDMDIAKHILDLCDNEEQIQRVGKELLLYQEKNLFDLLKYLKYLVDTMYNNNIIWGVGRGSSVASYVLYLLGVHKIDSIYYDLDPEEFLR
jgi:DNA polymerase III alpha subunit